MKNFVEIRTEGTERLMQAIVVIAEVKQKRYKIFGYSRRDREVNLIKQDRRIDIILNQLNKENDT